MINLFQSKRDRQNEIEVVTIEELVPENHLLRKIDTYVDFSFIPKKVRPFYCEDNGCPSLDPLVSFKMMFYRVFIWNSFRARIRETDSN